MASIINYAADRVRTTRAAIRLPIGTQMEAFISVVNFPDAPDVTPNVLGTFRTGEATLFSWDVAVQKARTAIGFQPRLPRSVNITAVSLAYVGFLAESNYPPGIDGNNPGPFFRPLTNFPGFQDEPNAIHGMPVFPGSAENYSRSS